MYSCSTGYILQRVPDSSKIRISSTVDFTHFRYLRPMISTPTTQITESYAVVESRITQAIDILRQRSNIAAAACEFFVPEWRLRARWNDQQSRFERPAASRKFSDAQELAVCQYLDRLDEIGMSARHFMVTKCANALELLLRSYDQTAWRLGYATTSQ